MVNIYKKSKFIFILLIRLKIPMLLIYIYVYICTIKIWYIDIHNYNFKLVIRNSFVSQHSSILHLKFNGITHIFILKIYIKFKTPRRNLFLTRDLLLHESNKISWNDKGSGIKLQIEFIFLFLIK